MDGFNYDINTYSNTELQQIFELENKYLIDDLEKAADDFVDKIKNQENIEDKDKEKLVIFAGAAQTKLLAHLLEDIKSEDTKTSEIFDSGSTVLIKKSKESVSDIINPIKKKYTQKIINIDSRFRYNYYETAPTSLSFQLPIVLQNVESYKLLSINVPHLNYQITKHYKNNFFFIELIDSLGEYLNSEDNAAAIEEINLDGEYDSRYVGSSGSKKFKIEIDEGNYTLDEMKTEILKKINAVSDLSGSFVIETVSKMNKLIIKVKTKTDTLDGTFFNVPFGEAAGFNNSDVYKLQKINILFGTDDNGNENNKSIQQKLGWLLGFRADKYILFPLKSENGYGPEIKTEGFYEPNGNRYLYLIVNDFNSNVAEQYLPLFNTSILKSNVLTKIDLVNPNFSGTILDTSMWDPSTASRNFFGPVTIKKLEIELIDEFGRLFDLKHMDWSLTLEFKCIYD